MFHRRLKNDFLKSPFAEKVTPKLYLILNSALLIPARLFLEIQPKKEYIEVNTTQPPKATRGCVDVLPRRLLVPSPSGLAGERYFGKGLGS